MRDTELLKLIDIQFYSNALIDEEIKFKLIKVKKNFAIGKLIEVISESDDRVTPPCIYYAKCGGCQYI